MLRKRAAIATAATAVTPHRPYITHKNIAALGSRALPKSLELRRSPLTSVETQDCVKAIQYSINTYPRRSLSSRRKWSARKDSRGKRKAHSPVSVECGPLHDIKHGLPAVDTPRMNKTCQKTSTTSRALHAGIKSQANLHLVASVLPLFRTGPEQ